MRSSSMAMPRRGEKLSVRAQSCGGRGFCFEGAYPTAVAGLDADARVERCESVRPRRRRLLRRADRREQLGRERRHLRELGPSAGEFDDEIAMAAGDRE